MNNWKNDEKVLSDCNSARTQQMENGKTNSK